ncbi:MAG TPA: ABC transporter ATP-binding protein [Terriglobia bacterium]|nr:ABC transporter ATP-binding protein [Terriglobia bacterium]
MNNAILSGTNLTKKYENLEVVKGVSLTVAAGEFVSLVGKSGSGKTTLLSLLSGLEKPTAGTVVLGGTDITTASEDELALFRRDNVGFVFQSFNLIPTLSAWENVALPLFPINISSDERRQRATDLLGKMELANRIEHLPSALSGGEKQRVAIARALINHPKIIFADEPTGNLDSATGEAIMQILNRLHREDGVAILMVTHDEKLAGTANRLLCMKDGEIRDEQENSSVGDALVAADRSRQTAGSEPGEDRSSVHEPRPTLGYAGSH